MIARQIIATALLAGSLVGLQACDLIAPTTPPPATPTVIPTATPIPDTSGEAQIDAVLPQLIEQEAAWLSAAYTAKSIYITFGTLPLIEAADQNGANTRTWRTQWTNMLNRQVLNLGEDYRPVFMLVEQEGQVETISFYEADATPTDAPRLYFWLRQSINATQSIPSGRDEKFRVIVGHTPAGRSVWMTEAGTVLQYTPADGNSILFPLSDDPLFLAPLEAGTPASSIDLADIDRQPQEFINSDLSVTGLRAVTPTRLGAEFGLSNAVAYATVIGDNRQETAVLVDAEANVLASWNVATLTWDEVTQTMVRGILAALNYAMVDDQALNGFQGASRWASKAERSTLPRRRRLCTSSKKPK